MRQRQPNEELRPIMSKSGGRTLRTAGHFAMSYLDENGRTLTALPRQTRWERLAAAVAGIFKRE